MRDSMGQPQIYFQLNPAGTIAFAELTRTNVDHRLAIVLDGELSSAPVIKAPMETGLCEISGSFTDTEARALANLMGDPLPVPVTLVEFKNLLTSWPTPPRQPACACASQRRRKRPCARAILGFFRTAFKNPTAPGSRANLQSSMTAKDKFLAVGLF